MKWFDNLKLAYKLALSFGVCLILSLLAGVVALNKLSFQNDNTNSIVNGPLAEVGYLGDLRNDTKQYRIYQLRAYLMTDQAELATDLQDIAKRAGTIDADLDNYEKHATAADDKENLQELRKNWAAYRAFDAPIVKSIEAHDFKTGAIIMNGPSKTAFDGATEQLRKMDKWNTSNSQALSANSASAYSSGRLLVIVLLSIALLVGVATATSVTKSITAVVGDIASRIESLNNICIANLLAAIENLAKGKLDSTIVIGSKPIKIHGRDEFGVLSEAINGMIGKVQASVTGFDRGQKALKALIDHTHETVIQSVDQLDKNALSPLCDGISALADGDLTRKIDAHIEKMEVDEASDLGKLAIAFNKVGARVEQALENYNRSRESLGNLIGQASGAAENITASAAELATGNEDLSSRTSEQASSLEETAASMEEMTGTVKQNAENARHANDVAKQAREVAQSGGVIVQNAVK
ncbi:MAG: MCP four helix bundle domain-containing protein, partial [Capsulimonadaceae bacterium]|nr:MCP four helix bundle domain-containing protein [Capsulimonadaceae bacterium]